MPTFIQTQIIDADMLHRAVSKPNEPVQWRGMTRIHVCVTKKHVLFQQQDTTLIKFKSKRACRATKLQNISFGLSLTSGGVVVELSLFSQSHVDQLLDMLIAFEGTHQPEYDQPPGFGVTYAQHDAAVLIQATWRGHHQQKLFDKLYVAAVIIQMLWRGYKARQLGKRLRYEKEASKHQAQRTRVLMELFVTEQNYVANLQNVVRLFIKPLRSLCNPIGSIPAPKPLMKLSIDVISPSNAQLAQPGSQIQPVKQIPSSFAEISPEALQAIFQNIEDILDLHVNFLENLTKVVDGWDEYTNIGDLLQSLADRFYTYHPYCNGYDESREMLALCMRFSGFAQFVSTVQQLKQLLKQDLASLLILPIQRIPRYELLLKDLLKNTWNTHQDYEPLQVAIKRIKEEAVYMNRAKAFKDNKKAIVAVQMSSAGSTADMLGSLSIQPNVRMSQNMDNPKSPVQRLSTASKNELSPHRQTSSSALSLGSYYSLNQSPLEQIAEQRYIGEGTFMYQDITFQLKKKGLQLEEVPMTTPQQRPKKLVRHSRQTSAVVPSKADVKVKPNIDIDTLLSNMDNDEAVEVFSQQVYAFLFTDSLVITSRSDSSQSTSSKIQKKGKMTDTFKYHHLQTINVYGLLIQEQPEPKQFQVITEDDRTHLLSFDTVEQKKKWLSDLQEAQGKSQLLGRASPMFGSQQDVKAMQQHQIPSMAITATSDEQVFRDVSSYVDVGLRQQVTQAKSSIDVSNTGGALSFLRATLKSSNTLN